MDVLLLGFQCSDKLHVNFTQSLQCLQQSLPALGRYGVNNKVAVFIAANLNPVEFFNHMADGWEEACPEYGGMLVHEGRENNYPVAIWLLRCPNNPMTNKPEFTYVKGISGNENFYTVQLAYALQADEIDDSIVNQSMAFLKQVTVCDDSRPQTHACN